MKKFFVLLCAVLMLALSLCACMNTSAGRVDETQAPTTFVKPTEHSKGSEALAETRYNDKVMPTDDDSEIRVGRYGRGRSDRGRRRQCRRKGKQRRRRQLRSRRGRISR